jgi:hypothetical protein
VGCKCNAEGRKGDGRERQSERMKIETDGTGWDGGEARIRLDEWMGRDLGKMVWWPQLRQPNGTALDTPNGTARVQRSRSQPLNA